MMYGLSMTLGDKIAKLRQDRDWTQKELADRAGITQNQVSRIEKGKTQPRRSTTDAIAAAFGIDASDIEILGASEEESVAAQIAKEDPDLAALFSQISLLSPKQREAIRVTLRSMIDYQKVKQVTGAAS